ncbi:MAG: OmpA family protein, partial [Myxococcota bacterium]
LTQDPPAWGLEKLTAGESVRLLAQGRVAADATLGTVVEVGGGAEVLGAGFTADTVRLVVGSGLGSGAVRGRVFRDRGQRDGRYQAQTDEIPQGFHVEIVQDVNAAAGEQPSAVLRAENLDSEGLFSMVGIPPGTYRLRAVSAEGTPFVESEVLGVTPDGVNDLGDLAIDPSGILYVEREGRALPVAGSQVFLVDVATGDDVAPEDLRFAQQGQLTTAQGFYRFDVLSRALPGSFRLRVQPPGSTFLFPSQVRPPAGATASNIFGDPPPAVGPNGRIVASDTPDLSGDTTYFLRFDLNLNSPDFVNNHIPLDHFDQRIRLTKTADKRRVERGDIVTYTVVATNPTDQSILTGDASGGAVLVDVLPSGIEYVAGSVRMEVVDSQGVSTFHRLGETSVNDRQVQFAPFDLAAATQVSLRYYGAVGIRAEGEQVNRAQLLAGSVQISPQASASVRVVDDPIFDEGTVLGRVFCDRDGDGTPSLGEEGLAGARLYLDTGYHVDVDVDGKYHFQGVEAGRHLIKLDPNTLPPGASMTTASMRDFMLTRGLLAKLDFGVRCNLAAVGPDTVALVERPPQNQVSVTIDSTVPAISLNGVVQNLPWVDGVLGPEGGRVNFLSGQGIELHGFGPLAWHLQVPRQVNIAQWQMSVFDLHGYEVWRVEGEGEIPAAVPWELTEDNNPFVEGAEYVYRIVAQTEAGDFGEGRWRRLRWVQTASVTEASVTTWNGPLFAGETANPTNLLKTKVAELAMMLKKQGRTDEIVIEGHSGGGGQRRAQMLLSQRRATMVKSLLEKQGISDAKMRALGLGDSQPLMPNVHRRAQSVNRRIVVRGAISSQTPGSAIAPIAYDAHAVLNARAVELEKHRASVTVDLDEGETLSLDVRQKNGRRVIIKRAFPFEQQTFETAAASKHRVEAQLQEGTLRIGQSLLELPLLTSTCGVREENSELIQDRIAKPFTFVFSSKAPINSWGVRVFNPAGTLLRELQGVDAPQKENAWELVWDGTNVGKQFVLRPGTYGYRCMASDVFGNQFVSAPQHFTVEGNLQKQISVPAVFEPSETVVFENKEFPSPGVALPRSLLRLIEQVQLNPRATLHVNVEDTASGNKLKDGIHLSRTMAEIKQQLLSNGVHADRLELSGKLLRRGVKSRRLKVHMEAPPRAPAPAPLSGAVSWRGCALRTRRLAQVVHWWRDRL